jgi:penicillin-binding protein 2
MNPDIERQRLFTRRAAVLGGVKVLLLSTLFGRLYYLQVMESDRYTMLAEENRINVRLLAPPRGLILDRNGVPLVRNRQDYRAVLVAERVPDREVERTLDALATILPIGKDDRRRIMREIARNNGFVPVTVRDHLEWENVAKIEINAPALPGVTIETGMSRDYLLGPAAAHIIGYVGAVDESELTNEPLLRLPDFRIGKNGVERVYDLALRGEAGTSQVEINAHGRVIRELSRREPKIGRSLRLTIDAEIQRFAYERLGEESGAVVVMDVHTGAILALASAPGYDPNAFDSGISIREWRALVSNPRAPLTNKAIGGQYAPGSTFKTIVALAALESGTIKPNHAVTCYGVTQLGDSRFHCWKKGGHGTLALHEAIKQSCDVYFYDVAQRTGVDRIAAMAKRFGLGEKLGIDLPGERPGVVPTQEWKRKTMNQPWYPGETLVFGIGQGYVLTTPLQLAVMTARIANGGRAVLPHLAMDEVRGSEILPRPRPNFPSIGVPTAVLETVKKGMYGVVNEPGGTAGRSRIDNPQFLMAGKTGTSQVRRIGAAERATGVIRNEDLQWEQRDHALFISYAPADAPRYACVVVVEHGGGGSAVAAPIARDVLIEVEKRSPILSDPAKLAESSPAPVKRAER